MEKKIINDSTTIAAKHGLTIDELIEKYTEVVNNLFAKYDNVHDIKIEPESGENYDDYYRDFVINFKRLETSKELEDRKRLFEFRDQEIKKREITKLKELLDKYTDIATQYINKDGGIK
jgi:hypothetical protein